MRILMCLILALSLASCYQPFQPYAGHISGPLGIEDSDVNLAAGVYESCIEVYNGGSVQYSTQAAGVTINGQNSFIVDTYRINWIVLDISNSNSGDIITIDATVNNENKTITIRVL